MRWWVDFLCIVSLLVMVLLFVVLGIGFVEMIVIKVDYGIDVCLVFDIV